MDDTLTIRDTTPRDAAAIADIYNESIRAGDATMDLRPKTPDDIRTYIAGFNERETYLLLERDDGYVIGWGVIKGFGEGPAYRHCCETSMYVRRAEIRKGYGSRIKRVLLQRCRRYGYHHCVARIWASNAASIAYYQSFGYELVGIQREIGYVNGRWQDIALMQLVLDDAA
jgi:phosphinothricin acetyltransferase